MSLPTTFMSNFVALTANGPQLSYSPNDWEPGFGAGLAGGGNVFSLFSITISAIPEPASVLLMAVGGLAVLEASRRRRKHVPHKTTSKRRVVNRLAAFPE